MSINRRLRESPVSASELSDAWRSYKTARTEDGGKATESRTAGREPRQENARQQASRDSAYTPRSHKCIPRRRGRELPDSQQRMDSREECYYQLAAWEGMSHE